MINLFVAGFPKDMDEMQLAQLFGPHGDILLLSIARDKVNGKSKGYGFIEMDDNGAAMAVAALNGYAFGDRLLEVRIAEDKQLRTKKPSGKPAAKFNPPSARPEKKKRPRIAR